MFDTVVWGNIIAYLFGDMHRVGQRRRIVRYGHLG
jgi:hypothetical protein